MKELKVIENLAALARKEPIPAVDVTHQVMQKLIFRSEPAVSFWWLAAAGLATVSTFIIFVQVYLVSQDPLVEFLESIRSVLL
ncbi:MAG: hypothetical protein WC980_06095 [Candidatus Brocadiia bacterium]